MDSNNKPKCFGELDAVFPMGKDGFRESPDACILGCEHKTECLRRALEGKKGDALENELLDRKYEAGKVGFLERWAKKKTLTMKK